MKNQDEVANNVQALKKVFKEIFERLDEYRDSQQEEYVNADEAKRLLGIKSNSTLQKLRDEGRIIFSMPMHKVILYQKKSIMDFIKMNVQEKF